MCPAKMVQSNPPVRHGTRHRTAALWLMALILLMTAAARAALTLPDVPLMVKSTTKPMVMLVASKDHRLFYEAYNDASDIDGDGSLDVRFKPSITYIGLFNPGLCYLYERRAANDPEGSFFRPWQSASGEIRTCRGSWSGNWLNYVTTSRIDALRVVLYGGMREVDTDKTTILRRAYIPQDAHSWAKEYTSIAVDGYSISDYTPLTMPDTGRRHLFGNMTEVADVSCTTLSDCSGIPPSLVYIQNSIKRVWEWASSERPVLAKINQGSNLRGDFQVRVKVCTSTFTEGCKAYGPENARVYKPIGLLQTYGENDQILFGLLTGSYDQNMAGGRLRKVVSSFSNEVNKDTGQFNDVAGIVRTFNSLRIRDFNNGRKDQTYKKGWVSTRAPNAGEFSDWGNPIGEMMVEALRYFAGKKSPSAQFKEPTTIDSEVGLESATWDDPYAEESSAKALSCTRANMLVISDVNVSYDSDQVPGAAEEFSNSGYTADLTGFSATAEAATITGGEPDVKGKHFIGQSGKIFDSAPSPKDVDSLGTIRGLAPEEPTKQGSFTAAAAAFWGRRTDLRPLLPGRQSVDTFVVALASSLPQIRVPVAGTKFVTLVPFAKTVAGGSISAAKGAYQPTNQIVDFYVEELANSGPGDRNPNINGGRYSASFRISFEDVEQGGDHEMDAIALYKILVNAEGKVVVTVTAEYASGGNKQNMGYVISGTEDEGIYLEVQDENEDLPYFLNTPPGKPPNYCDTTEDRPECKRLPNPGKGSTSNSTTRTFTVGTNTTATWLKGPLWYAAKWGGFVDGNNNLLPDKAAEWDVNNDGVPDTYIQVQNPLKLKLALQRTLETVLARSASAGSLATNSTSLTAGTLLFEAQFDTLHWSGDLYAKSISSDGSSPNVVWQASNLMPDWDKRKIYLNRVGAPAQLLKKWSELDAIDKASIVNQANVEYLLGNRDLEIQHGGSLRDRSSPLGDIVYSAPVHDRTAQSVFVSANDGMLHAFAADTGKELFAFIPRSAVPGLAGLSSPAYQHRFLVDGDIAISPRTTTTDSRSYLYGLLGRGSKGLFSLDVTRPQEFGPEHVLWEYTPAANKAANTDPNLGAMLSKPVVANLANGMLGVLVGNGYNSTDGKSVLYIFIIRPNGSLAEVRTIVAGAGPDNGLAGPAVYDSDQDGRIDVAYAGDLAGNVWKFDLSSADPNQWTLAFAGKPLFVAKGPDGTAQPITASLTVARNNRSTDPNFGKRFLFFGTGAYFRDSDPADTQTQSWWGIIDHDVTPIPADRTLIQIRKVADTGTLSEKPVRTFSSAVVNDMANRRGWVVDLDNPAKGERIISGSQLVDLYQPALMVNSIIPKTANTCLVGGTGYRNLIDPFTGGALDNGVIDVNGDGDPSNDRLNDRPIGSVDLGIGITGQSILITQVGGYSLLLTGGSGNIATGTTVDVTRARPGSNWVRRIAWREIFTD